MHRHSTLTHISLVLVLVALALSVPAVARSDNSAIRGLNWEATTLRFSVIVPGEGLHQVLLQRGGLTFDALSSESVTELRGWIRESRRRIPAVGVLGESALTLSFTSRRRHLPVFVSIERRNGAAHISWARPFQAVQCSNASLALTGEGVAPESMSRIESTESRILSIATSFDAEWYARYGKRSNQVIRTVILAASSIYEEQLGIRLYITSQSGFRSSSQPYLSTNAVTLLEQFAESRRQARSFGSALTQHLFSGKHLNAGIAGVAYLGTICTNNSLLSFGLSERSSTALQPLIFAHELGHNLSATHDEMTLSLMSPAISPSEDRFSERSLVEIAAFLGAEGSCVQDSPTPIVSLSARGKRGSIPQRIRADFQPTTGTLESCTATLQAAKTAEELEVSPRTVRVKRVAGVSDGEAATVLGKAPKALARRRRVYVRGLVQCGEYSTLTDTVPVRLR